jgi:hypothetical protein
MNLRPVLGLVAIAAIVAIAQPTILSAQNEPGSDQPQVRLKLLESGEIEITGDVVLDVPELQKELWLTGTSVIEDRNRDPAAPLGSFLLEVQTPNLEGISDTISRARDARIVRVR